MLKVNNLTIKYHRKERVVLHGLSFEIKKGEIVAILGPSGCGKTTLLSSIQGLFDAEEIITSGSIEIQPNAIVRTVFQEPRLLPWCDVLQNISFGQEAMNIDTKDAEVATDELLGIVKLKDFALYFPGQLSLGMKQRVNFARALVCNPDILLLDEPFSSLDEETKKAVMTDFKTIIKEKNITGVFVTHSIEEAKFMTQKIIYIDNNPKVENYDK